MRSDKKAKPGSAPTPTPARPETRPAPRTKDISVVSTQQRIFARQMTTYEYKFATPASIDGNCGYTTCRDALTDGIIHASRLLETGSLNQFGAAIKSFVSKRTVSILRIADAQLAFWGNYCPSEHANK